MARSLQKRSNSIKPIYRSVVDGSLPLHDRETGTQPVLTAVRRSGPTEKGVSVVIAPDYAIWTKVAVCLSSIC